MEVYLDNSATTKVFPEVFELMKEIMCENYGNPSSLHMKGVDAEKYVKDAKEIFAKILKVNEKEIFFTSGGTESDNLAIIGCAFANRRRGNHLITTRIEHPAVIQTMKYLETQGFEVTYLPVDKSGRISLDELKNAINENTILVSIMHTNNEVGSLQPVIEAGELIKRINSNILFHVDAVQGFGKAKIYPKKMNIDLLSISGHKIHGPKGIGVLYVNDKVKIQQIAYGGGQQMGLRSGTENVPGIAGMAKAAWLLYNHIDEDEVRLHNYKQKFIKGLEGLEDVYVNGLVDDDRTGKGTASHIISVSFRGVRSEVLLHSLEDKGIYVSAGSACSAHKPQPSETLKAMNVEKALLESTIRFSMSVYTKEEEIDYTLEVLYDIIPMLRKYSRR